MSRCIATTISSYNDLSISAEIFSFFLTLLDLPTAKIYTKPVRLTENILLKPVLVYVKYLLNGSCNAHDKTKLEIIVKKLLY